MSETLAERYRKQADEAEQLREWMERTAYMTVADVAEYRGVSPSKVREYPWEVLPWSDASPTSERTHRRYHPRDVLALSAVLRAWKRAMDEGREGEWKRERHDKLEARERAEIEQALEPSA